MLAFDSPIEAAACTYETTVSWRRFCVASSRQAIARETYGDADARGPGPGIRLGWLLVRYENTGSLKFMTVLRAYVPRLVGTS